MDFIERFADFLRNNCKVKPDDKLLVGVSGGIDSMTLSHLLLKINQPFGIAHCNFKLRGRESDEDEHFVRSFAEQNNIEFFSKSFDTQRFARENKLSIQVAARELRFKWFFEILNEYGFNFIALAHNADDQIETMFLNLLRSTGIKGLKAMLSNQNLIVRPLLFAFRHEIEHFADENQIIYREDSSNKTTKYARNKIRHLIIPQIETVFPKFKKNVLNSINYFSAQNDLLDELLDYVSSQALKTEGKRKIIDLGFIRKFENSKVLLFLLLQPLNFNIRQVEAIIYGSGKSWGESRMFLSKTHKAYLKNDLLEIKPIEKKASTYFEINSLGELATREDLPYAFLVNFYNKNDLKNYKVDKNTILIDKNKLTFPLIIRKWQKGDYFYPFGMTKRKLLSDFFIDAKMTQLEKEETWLLCSKNKIIWIIEHRADNRFRISDETEEVVCIKVKSKK